MYFPLALPGIRRSREAAKATEIMSENQLLKEQAADTRLIAEFDTGIKNIKANESYKAYLAGKKLFDEVAELEKKRAHLELRKSLRAQEIGDVRTVNAAPELHELLAELHEEKPKTWAALETREQTNWLGTTTVVTNKKLIEQRIALLDAGI